MSFGSTAAANSASNGQPPRRRVAAVWDSLAAVALAALLTLGIFLPDLAKLHQSAIGHGSDVFDNIWDVWWVREAVVARGTHPWFCDLLFYDAGTPLWFHSLTPIHGLLATPILPWLGQPLTHNTLVMGNFVLAGFAGWLLVGVFTANRIVRLLAVVLFLTCPWRVAHTESHLNFAATGFATLFLWSVARGAACNRMRSGILAALLLLATALADLHFLLFALMLAPFVFWSTRARKRDGIPLPGRRRFALGLALGSIVLLGPIVAGAVWERSNQRYTVGHRPEANAADLLLYVVPGARSAWGEPFRPIWSFFSGNSGENAGGLGLTVALGALLALRFRFRESLPLVAGALAFGLLSFGPELCVGGRRTGLVMPYGFFEGKLPWLTMLGTPVRFSFGVFVCGSLLACLGWDALVSRGASARRDGAPHQWAWKLAGLLPWCLVLFAVVERWPSRLPTTDLTIGDEELAVLLTIRDEPGSFAVLHAPAQDMAWGKWLQTIHRRPMIGGFMSRYRQRLLDDLQASPGIAPLYGLRKWGSKDMPLPRSRRELLRRNVRYVISVVRIHPTVQEGLGLEPILQGKAFAFFRVRQ